MKFIKKFNEELDPRIYRNAARKLTKMGHLDRAKKLKDWSVVVDNRVNMARWNKNIEENSKFGKFKVKINDGKGNHLLTDDFYLDITFDDFAFSESLVVPGNNTFCLFVGLIPTNEETIKKFSEIFPSADFDNGFFWGMVILINFDVTDSVKIIDLEISEYDQSIAGKPIMADRKSAVQLKNLLKNMFGNPDFNYPSGMTDVDYIYEFLEKSICIENGFSSNYGFSLDDVAKFIDKISPNELFKS